ncbi:hypothetical protein [Spiribacter vilamensis]|uniref:Uncharacterized protein n=1 Tax=Spiribacter vilamensis TaxID=531306 RepID=A0A4Q8D0B3_9GAMM|nr:hypothetical protein [Spiribacter vilamensis]RZU98761.1 hypothetical protein EV698_1022 [Spiribacter vilamensis]TVO62217.1 hypothetical protein FPL09_09105 [Spiribacter vilamensis]
MYKTPRMTLPGRRRWLALAGLLLVLGLSPVASAQEGIVEGCQIEEYSYEERMGQLYITGSATCSEARLDLTVFDDASGEEIASDFTYIMDGEFEVSLNAPVPEAIVLEYIIE